MLQAAHTGIFGALEKTGAHGAADCPVQPNPYFANNLAMTSVCALAHSADGWAKLPYNGVGKKPMWQNVVPKNDSYY
jgi:hypothetical protein